jgi:hypothetical protein
MEIIPNLAWKAPPGVVVPADVMDRRDARLWEPDAALVRGSEMARFM